MKKQSGFQYNQTIWIVKKKKEDEKLVVPKVVKQYTRKKRDENIEKKSLGIHSTGPLASGFSVQSCSDIKVENDVRIKEENENDTEFPNTQSDSNDYNEVDISIKTEPPESSTKTISNKFSETQISIEPDNATGIPSDEGNSKQMPNPIHIVSKDVSERSHINSELNCTNVSQQKYVVKLKKVNGSQIKLMKNMGDSSTSSIEVQQTPDRVEGELNIKTEPVEAKSSKEVKEEDNKRVMRQDSEGDQQTKDVGSPDKLPPFKMVAKSEIFTCQMCDQNFLNKQDVKAHLDSAHRLAMRYKCDKCPARFPHLHRFISHLRRHANKPFACDLCPKRFKTDRTFSVHVNSHLRERLFTCPVCLRRLTNLEALHRHAAIHGSEKDFVCESCTEEKMKYGSFPELRYHQEKVHNEKPPYPCYVCTRVLKSKTDFYDHLKTHDNAVYECAFCPKRFTDPTRWEEHSTDHILKIKTNKTFANAPHACDICHKRFMYKSTLTTHMRSHTGERPYSCSICSKKYKTASTLKEHEYSHDRPFECTVCSTRFGKRNTLERHLRTHSGDRPYSCSTCGATFTQRSSLTNHNQRQHAPRVPKKRGRKPLAKSKSKKNKR